jgi:hypothetical protein
MTEQAARLIRYHASHIQAARGGWTAPAVALARAARARQALAIELQRARRP